MHFGQKNEYGVKDHTINLLYDGGIDTNIAIRTPVGITQRKKVKKILLCKEIFGLHYHVKLP